ncbi:23387_t:CDS:2, partial [Gigaspora margarita]
LYEEINHSSELSMLQKDDLNSFYEKLLKQHQKRYINKCSLEEQYVHLHEDYKQILSKYDCRKKHYHYQKNVKNEYDTNFDNSDSKKTLLKIKSDIQLQLDKNYDSKNNFKNIIASAYESNDNYKQFCKEFEK